jgi:hypothetical protein
VLAPIAKGFNFAEIAAVLRECLDDLRITIDSLETDDHQRLPALGNLRYRIDGRLRTVGIELDWKVEDLPELSCKAQRYPMAVVQGRAKPKPAA